MPELKPFQYLWPTFQAAPKRKRVECQPVSLAAGNMQMKGRNECWTQTAFSSTPSGVCDVPAAMTSLVLTQAEDAGGRCGDAAGAFMDLTRGKRAVRAEAGNRLFHRLSPRSHPKQSDSYISWRIHNPLPLKVTPRMSEIAKDENIPAWNLNYVKHTCELGDIEGNYPRKSSIVWRKWQGYLHE